MAKGNYMACVAFVRKWEGGNTNTPGDRGGRTGRGGITHAVYDDYRAHMQLPLRDVYLIGDEEIAAIYKTRYWDTAHGDELAFGVDLAVFDYAINSGPKKANWERLTAMSGGLREPGLLISKICAGRLSFMHGLGSWSRFGRGWGRRVAECEATALHMARAPLQPVLDAAKAGQSKVKKQAGVVLLAGMPAGAVVHQWTYYGFWTTAEVIGVIMLLATIQIFNAWRQGQRAAALSAAIKRMRDAEAAAFAAKMAIDKAALAAVPDAIMNLPLAQS